jgi:hypothetical protein
VRTDIPLLVAARYASSDLGPELSGVVEVPAEGVPLRARVLRGQRTVCAPAGEDWNAGFYSQGHRFGTGAVLIAVCESRHHSVLRAVLRDRPETRADAAAESAAAC